MRTAKLIREEPRCDGVITSLAPKSGRSERVVVRLDGARAFELAGVVVEQAGLRTGHLLTHDEQDRLLAEDAPYRARERALKLLAVCDRCRREVEVRLEKAGFDRAVIAKTVAWLRELGYLDEERFVARYVTDRLKAGWGEQRIRAELLRKGLERSRVDEALCAEETSAAAAAEGAEAVMALARRRFGGQFAADPRTAARRLSGFLARRGYDWDEISRVTRALSLEAGGGEETPAGESSGGEVPFP